jgi:hypothetical protein
VKLTWKGGSGHHIASLEREGRPCNTADILAQIGTMNILAVSGGRVGKFTMGEGDEVGVFLPITHDRRVEVVLGVMDTYSVRRVRHILKGANIGSEVVESEVDDVYCDEVAEAVYQASVWK